MSSEYNNFLYFPVNNNEALLNYYTFEKSKVNPFIEYLQKNECNQSNLNAHIHQDIHTKNNSHSNSVKSNNILHDNNKDKYKYLNKYSPNIIDWEISIDDNVGYNNNNMNNNNYISKSPNNKIINPINFDNSILSIDNVKQNRVRSPKILRNNYYKLNNKNNNKNIIDNNELILKKKSILNKYPRSPSPLTKEQNNICQMKYVQYNNNKINNNINHNNLCKKLTSKSPSNNILSSCFKSRKEIECNGNSYNYSTMYSKSPKSSINQNNNKKISFETISNFSNHPFSYIRELNNFQNSTSELNNFEFLTDKPMRNTFKTVYEKDKINYRTNYNNINNEIITTNGKKIKNDIKFNLKEYKPIFPNTQIKSINTNSTNKELIGNIALSPSPQKISNFINKKEYVNGKKSFSPNYFQIKSGNTDNLINSKRCEYEGIFNSNKKNNEYSFNIKSSLPKIINNNSKREFSSNNINDISFGDNDNSDKSSKISFHKYTPIENILPSSINEFNLSKKFLEDSYEIESDPYDNLRNRIISQFSNNKGLYKSINFTKLNTKKISCEYFNYYMIENINKIRVEPISFVPILRSAIGNIKYNNKGKLYYNGKIKVALCKGKQAFDEAISFLEKANPMKPLIYKEELCVEIPKKEKDFKSGDYLKKEINKMIMNGIIIRAFWRDIISDPQINFLLMIVDDNFIRRGAKRKDILNPDMKYFGINSGNMGDNFVCYTVLSDE